MEYNNRTTAQDFMDLKGLDLYSELSTIRVGDLGDPDMEVNCFIYQIEDYLLTYYEVNYSFNGVIKFENQIKNLKKAVVNQALYSLAHPDIRKAIQNSIMIPKDIIASLAIDVDTHLYMRKGGFANV